MAGGGDGLPSAASPPRQCSLQPIQQLGNASEEMQLQTNATYHEALRVYHVHSTLQLRRVDEPLLLRCAVQNLLGTSHRDIKLVPHGKSRHAIPAHPGPCPHRGPEHSQVGRGSLLRPRCLSPRGRPPCIEVGEASADAQPLATHG